MKPRVLKEATAPRPPKPKIERPWLKKFPKTIHVDETQLGSKKTVVLYAGRAARLRNRLRNHPLKPYASEGTEIWIWLSPDSTVQKTLESRKPDLKLAASDFRKAPDEPAVYVWVRKPKRVK